MRCVKCGQDMFPDEPHFCPGDGSGTVVGWKVDLLALWSRYKKRKEEMKIKKERIGG